MKQLLIATVLTAFSLTACAKEDKKLPAVEVVADAPVTKKACVTQKDAKTGKEKEVCKTIKIHKKLDVTDQKK